MPKTLSITPEHLIGPPWVTPSICFFYCFFVVHRCKVLQKTRGFHRLAKLLLSHLMLTIYWTPLGSLNLFLFFSSFQPDLPVLALPCTWHSPCLLIYLQNLGHSIWLQFSIQLSFILTPPFFFPSLLSSPFQGSICAFDHISFNFPDLIPWLPSLISPHFSCSFLLAYYHMHILKKLFSFTLIPSELPSYYSFFVCITK